MASLVFCGACRKQVSASDTVCPHCGAPRGRRFKDRTTAGILALLFGGLGAHRFYLGQWWGIFYLLLCWTAIPALVAIVEGIVFLCSSQEQWDAKYNDGIRTANEGTRVGLVIALAAIGVFGLFVLGILAAIAIPAYADYTARSKVALALTKAREATLAVEQYVADHNALPASLAAAGFDASLPPNVESIALRDDDGSIVVTMSGAPFDRTGASFALSPTNGGDTIVWECGAVDIPERYLPRRCRQSRE
jgi:TM2 domain-containing membrane protein YozV/Tfp pilus assembly protein PilE